MQNRYVGDIGDFAKYGLLRVIQAIKHLGVAWYLHPDEGPNGDGRHTEYLSQSEEFENLDRHLFVTMEALRGDSAYSPSGYCDQYSPVPM